MALRTPRLIWQFGARLHRHRPGPPPIPSPVETRKVRTEPPPPPRGGEGKEKRERIIVVVRSPCQENYPADAHPSALKSALESANPRMDSEGASGCTWSTARATAPSPGRPTPGVVQQDKSSGGSVDTTKTRSDPQRVRMSSGERPIGAAKGKQSDTEALCQTPAPPRGDALGIRSAPGLVFHFHLRKRHFNASLLFTVPRYFLTTIRPWKLRVCVGVASQSHLLCGTALAGRGALHPCVASCSWAEWHCIRAAPWFRQGRQPRDGAE